MAKWSFVIQSYTDLSRWTNLFRIQKFRKKITDAVQWGCTDPEGLKRLMELLEDEHYFNFLSCIDRLKITLSRDETAEFIYRSEAIDIRRSIRRSEFEEQIQPLMNKASRVLETAFHGTGLNPSDVQSVFLTGGSSQIPAFRAMIASSFDATLIREGNAFTSVAEGLACQ